MCDCFFLGGCCCHVPQLNTQGVTQYKLYIDNSSPQVERIACLTGFFISPLCHVQRSYLHFWTVGAQLSNSFGSKPQSRVCEPIFPLCRTGSFVISLVAAAFLNSNWQVQQWEEKAVMCKIHMRNLKSHFRRDFLAYCTRPVSVHFAVVCVSCSFNNLSVFLLCFTQQQNLMELLFSCIHFPIWPYPPQIIILFYFIQLNCMG